MKKTLNLSFKVVSLIGVLTLAVAGCTSSGGSSSSDTTTTPEATLSGAVAKGYVEGATVVADKIPDGETRGNLQLDDGEASDTSDGFGDYEVAVPANYGDYLLVSLGGTLIGSGAPAPSMMAPKDAANITPVTTMVSLNPNLRSKIGEEKFDLDIADVDGTDGAVLALAMTAKTVLDCLGSNTALTDSQQISVLAALADAFEDTANLTDTTEVTNAVKTAVKAVVADTAVFNAEEVAFDEDAAEATATAIGSAVTTIVTAIDMTSTVTESSVEDTVKTAIDTATPTIDQAIKVAKVSLTSLVLKNSGGGVMGTINSTDTSVTISEANAMDSERLVFTLNGRNDFDALKTYSDAQLIVELKDVNSLRKAKAVISGVTVKITVDDTVSITLGTSTKLRITGTDSLGDAVDVTLTNASVTGDSNIVTVSNNVVTLNMDALGAKVESETAAEALYEIGLPGTYTVNMKALVAPLIPVGKTIIVQ